MIGIPDTYHKKMAPGDRDIPPGSAGFFPGIETTLDKSPR